MADILYAWPEAARFGKTIPKTKFYEHGRLPTGARARFVAQVDRITWAYKLAESTINLPGTAEVPEIQVLVVKAKAGDVDDALLAVIDKAIKQPIIFEIVTAQRIRMTAALKSGSKGGRYYSTGWSQDEGRLPLPSSISLPHLYAALVDPLLPISIGAGERVADAADRLTAISRLEREVNTLERELRAEPQLNRKVELRRTLMVQRARLADLTNSTTAPTTATKTNRGT